MIPATIFVKGLKRLGSQLRIRRIPRHNELLDLAILIHKLPLTDMVPLLLLAGNPHLILKLPLFLALLMLERALRVQARIEPAHRLDMRKLAPLLRAICAVPAQWHGGMPEGTS